MECNFYADGYRLTAENKKDEEFLELLNDAFKRYSDTGFDYRHVVLVKSGCISTCHDKQYIDFKIDSLNFKIKKPFQIDVITCHGDITSKLSLNPKE